MNNNKITLKAHNQQEAETLDKHLKNSLFSKQEVESFSIYRDFSNDVLVYEIVLKD